MASVAPLGVLLPSQPFDLRVRVEAMGIEPTNLLHAMHPDECPRCPSVFSRVLPEGAPSPTKALAPQELVRPPSLILSSQSDAIGSSRRKGVCGAPATFSATSGPQLQGVFGSEERRGLLVWSKISSSI